MSTATGHADSVSPYLQGAFTPVDREVTAFDLPVEGRIPAELDGLFTQIGPNPVQPPKHRTLERYSFFAQDGMVSGVRIQDGGACWFRNRWVRSRRVVKALGERRPPGPRHFPMDTVNTNIIAHNGLLLALVETGCLPVHLGSTLETMEYTDLGGSLQHGVSAHPKLDPTTGELHLLAYSALRRWAEYLVLAPDSTVCHRQRVPLGGRPMVHDIALTPRYVLFFDTPVRFSLGAAVRGALPYTWHDGHQTRLGVLPRPGVAGGLRWFEIPDGFVFHMVGAHEPDPARIELTAICYDRLFDGAEEDPIANRGHLWRWTVDLNRGTATADQIGDRPNELPRSDPRRIGQPMRHYYALTVDGATDAPVYHPHALLRHDFRTGEPLIRRLPPGHAASEPVFVPHPDRPGEDEGWVAYYEHDPNADTTKLVWLHAADFAGEPVATIALPIRIPVGFHCSWIEADDFAGTDSAFAH
ncbi:carotenoid oxygenase family protein [Nocardia sp. NPDC049190]|uniref:carotenoid oxygenase family protein n=1 Tax=Nocardia sp. NPDC049190 TaxID=3155650 RepID=UPI0034032576